MTPAPRPDPIPDRATIVVVGGGPRASGLLERLGANAPELLARPLEVHLVDPHPVGAGRVWRDEQSPLLRMNSMAEDVTAFTDDSVVCEGPIRTGPSLAEWADLVLSGGIEVPLDEAVRAELSAMRPTSFPSRRVQSAYLTWFHRLAEASLPEGSRVVEHRAEAVRLTGDEAQSVWLDGEAEPLVADVVVLALGHLDAEPTPQESALAAQAKAANLRYLPPDYTADTDLSTVPEAEDVLVRGLGLAFIDLAVLLAQGRGGRFAREDGVLRYHPSGREPRLLAGSRRGVPYHSKTGYRLQGAPPEPPRFLDVRALLTRPGPVDFRRDVWPLIAKDVALGFYRELFTAHPDRVTRGWPEFSATFATLDWYSPRMRALEAESIPSTEDRLDFETLDRPLRGAVLDGPDELQAHLRAHIESDVARRGNPTHSADLGAFLALLGVYGALPPLLASGRLVNEDGWWHGFFSFLASGPPPDRLEELLALSEAGVVRFLGGDLEVAVEDNEFVARSPNTPGTETRATTLIEARLPDHTLPRTRSPLLRTLVEAGEVLDVAGLVRVDPTDSALLDRNGTPHPRRFAVGPYTNNKAHAAFARPKTNAPGFRQNDAVARSILKTLASEPVTPH
ncbi:FAD/NAD(P)-binding protein [Actinosynnema pretiosum]|uniref:FAD/NAD(P)-binding protein n=1 Tax=Actinosynnema pretiosum TaxID=42197 RepID=UPI001E607F1D|nr:FAD/NAD(P)-binding protein [Actinosynnema pretiosum]